VYADGVVYHGFMHTRCKRVPGAKGMVVAMDAKTGRVKWKVTTEVIESSLLEVNGDLFFGGWDGKIVSLDAKTGKQRWSYQADSGVTSSVAYHAGNVFVGSDGGAFYALDAGNGKLLWKSGAFSKFGTREYFYATPAVAYGRVYAPNTDGYVYSFGETTGKLRWARKVGTYVYSAPAIYKQTIYVGTYDGFLVALDAATGNVKWKYSTPAAVHGAATVVSGIVYFSTLKGQHSGAARFVKDGPGKTFGLTASSGKLVWSRPEGRYTPIIADGQRMYFTGLGHLYGLEPRK
jgi:outer membrane protein assembly factor BamB